MKKLLSILLIFSTVAAQGAFNFCTVTITNAPTVDGLAITVNGSTRTFTNNINSSPSTLILTNLTIGGSLTNMFNHFAAAPVSGVNMQPRTTTNSITFYGDGLAISVSTSPGWASVSCTPVTVGGQTNISVPASGWVVQERATNAFSSLATALNTHSTVALDQTLTIASQLVGLGNNQTITGNKTMTGQNVFAHASQFMHGGVQSNMIATNMVSFNGYIIGWVTNTDGFISGGILTNNSIVNAALISGTVSTLTNGGWINPKLTNGINYGNAFSSPGSGLFSEEFGESAAATGDNSTSIGASSVSSGSISVSLGFSASATNTRSAALGAGTIAYGADSTAVGAGAEATNTYSTALGAGSRAYHTNSVAIGRNAETTETAQIMLGSSDVDYIYANGRVFSSVGYTNATILGTNVVTAGISFTRLDNTSLANGNNAAVDIGGTAGGSRSNVKLTGPTAAFNINGVAGGWNGRYVILENFSGFPMTIANNSGVDPVAANRIYTTTGSDLTITNNPGVVHLKYDSAVSLWVVQNPPSTAVAGVTSVALTAPTAVFDIAGSPVTGSGTLAVTFDNQSANTVFAGPASGSATTPAFRALVGDDIPSHERYQFANRADTTVTGTSEATLTNATASGSITIPAGYLTQGSRIKITLGGTTANPGGGVSTFTAKLSGTAIWTTTVDNPDSSEYYIIGETVIRTTGGSGAFKSRGQTIDSSNGGVTHPSGSGTIDTTAANTIDVTYNSGTGTDTTCEVLMVTIIRP